jgi:hypothetical protein
MPADDMNCDLVFEILTRGPFPAGEPTDVSVELHLSRCHECRQLAEALRPAVELFHEALSDEEEASSLPGYYGAAPAEEALPATILTAAWSQPAARIQPAFGRSRRRSWSRPQLGPLGQVACGTALGAVLCLLLAFFLTGPNPPREETAANRDAARPQTPTAAAPLKEVRTVLASLRLPLACFQPVDGNSAPNERLGGEEALADATASLVCCTECHSAAAPRRPAVSAVALLQREACGACHRWQ